MTACIAPKAGIREFLKRADSKTRLEDYKRGLCFWATLDEPSIASIVFAENSGYPILELVEFVNQIQNRRCEVEFVSVDMEAPPDGLSYGYSEFMLIEHALLHSEKLSKCTHFIKATGRYIFPKISRLIRKLPNEFQIAADCRGARPWAKDTSPMILTTALVIFERRFYLREIASLYRTMVPAPPWDRRQFIEAILFDTLVTSRDVDGVILRWPCNCDPVGFGANGDKLNSINRLVKYKIRAVLRLLWPSLWF